MTKEAKFILVKQEGYEPVGYCVIMGDDAFIFKSEMEAECASLRFTWQIDEKFRCLDEAYWFSAEEIVSFLEKHNQHNIETNKPEVSIEWLQN